VNDPFYLTMVMVEICISNTLFVPNSPIWLLSPQQVTQQTQKVLDGFYMQANTVRLLFDGHSRTVLLDSTSNLPMSTSHSSQNQI